jgi:hypothetical protein
MDGESDESFYLRALPKPPAVGGDDVVAEWMRAVANEHGFRALDWAWQPENWPQHLKAWRPRLDHWFLELQRRDQIQAQRRAELAAHDAQTKVERERLQRRREAGWS